MPPTVLPTQNSVNLNELKQKLQILREKGEEFVEAWVEAAIALYEFYESQSYKGAGYKSFNQFRQEELGMSDSHAWRMISSGRRAKQERLSGADFKGRFCLSAFLEIGSGLFDGRAKAAIDLLPEGGTKSDLKAAAEIAKVTTTEEQTEFSRTIDELSGNDAAKARWLRRESWGIAKERGNGVTKDWTVQDVEIAAERWDSGQRQLSSSFKVPSSGSEARALTKAINRLAIALEPHVAGTVLECFDDLSDGRISRSLELWEKRPQIKTNARNLNFEATFHLSPLNGDLWAHLEDSEILIDWVIAAPPPKVNAAVIATGALSVASSGIALLLPYSFLVSKESNALLKERNNSLSLIKVPGTNKLWFVWTWDDKGYRRIPPLLL